MRNTIIVRLTDEVAAWVKATAARRGISQGRVIREQLEKARSQDAQRFLHLAGKVSGPADLSMREGLLEK